MEKLAKIINGERERAFDLVREPDALYLHVKCSDQYRHSKIVRIKVSDVIYQLWQKMERCEKHKFCRLVNEMIDKDRTIA